MDLAAEYFHRHTPLPRVLCQVVAAFYEPLLSELVARYLERHRTCTIVLHRDAECRDPHILFTAVRLKSESNGARCRATKLWREFPDLPIKVAETEEFAMTLWDTLDALPDFACACKTPRFETDLRKVCEADLRVQWTRLLVRRKRKF